MPRSPAWATDNDDGPRVAVFDPTKAAQEHLDTQVKDERDHAARTDLDKMRDTQTRLSDDVRQERAHIPPGVRGLPVDREDALRVLTEEQRVYRSSHPRTRRFKALEKLDRDVDALTRRHADAAARLQEADARFQRAPDDDARTLANWIAAGEKGDRPPASLDERRRERDAAALRVDALAVELDRALEPRLHHIEKNRPQMLKEARHDVAKARDQLLAHVRGLSALRDEILAARETLLWAAAFPDPAESFGFPTDTALGLAQPVAATLGTTTRVPYVSLVDLLEADANTVADSFGTEQKRQLGEATPKTPEDGAVWLDDPNDEDVAAWKRSRREHARQLAGNFHDPDQLAAEIRDER